MTQIPREEAGPPQPMATPSSSPPRILLLADWFAPGYKAGGPIRSCVNFCQQLEQVFDLHVITTDTDLGASQPYEGVQSNAWLPFGKQSRVWYCSKDQLTYSTLRQLIREVGPDVVYLNSMFSLPFTIWPLYMKWRGQLSAQLVLTPRGMLKASALRFRKTKKQLFLGLLKASGLPGQIRFHAADEHEAQDIRRTFGAEVDLRVAPNVPATAEAQLPPILKAPGDLRLVYMARIHPLKNLRLFLNILKAVEHPLHLAIYGPIQDASYWEACQQAMSALPAGVEVGYRGELPHERVREVLKEHHLLVLPSQGESFGHSIFEALSLGRPVLISDQTPFRDLANRQMGWDLSLNDPEGFRQALKLAYGMDQPQYNAWARAALAFAQGYTQASGLVQRYQALFT